MFSNVIFFTRGVLHHSRMKTELRVGDARGDYYGESSGSFLVREFGTIDQLEEIVKLASNPLPVSLFRTSFKL